MPVSSVSSDIFKDERGSSPSFFLQRIVSEVSSEEVGIVACAAYEDVVALSSCEGICVVASLQGVCARIALQGICAVSAVELVVAATAAEFIVAQAHIAGGGFCVDAAVELVCVVVACEFIVAIATDDILYIAERDPLDDGEGGIGGIGDLCDLCSGIAKVDLDRIAVAELFKRNLVFAARSCGGSCHSGNDVEVVSFQFDLCDESLQLCRAEVQVEVACGCHFLGCCELEFEQCVLRDILKVEGDVVVFVLCSVAFSHVDVEIIVVDLALYVVLFPVVGIVGEDCPCSLPCGQDDSDEVGRAAFFGFDGVVPVLIV